MAAAKEFARRVFFGPSVSEGPKHGLFSRAHGPLEVHRVPRPGRLRRAVRLAERSVRDAECDRPGAAARDAGRNEGGAQPADRSDAIKVPRSRFALMSLWSQ